MVVKARVGRLAEAAWLHWCQAAAVIRLQPFDTSTAEGRSRERYRRILLTALSSGAARGIGLVSLLISVPLTVAYLGQERYGLWITISSVVALLSFADLGVGNGLLNVVARAHGAEDHAAARRYIASAGLILSLIAMALAALLAVIYPWLPWSRLYNLSSELASAEAGPATATLLLCFLAGLPLGLVIQVRLAYQEGFINNFWQAVGGLLGLGLLILAVQREAGLPWLILAVAGVPVLMMAVNGLDLFVRSRPWLRPNRQALDLKAGRVILRTGTLFLALQIAAAVGYQTDNIVIAQFLGAAQVTQYAVPLRLFNLVPTVLSFFLMPTWPAYSEALARHDIAWARRTLRRSVIFCLAVSLPLVAGLIVFGPAILRAWVGTTVTPSGLLLVGLGLWALSTSLNGPLAMFLNGANVIAFQVQTAILMAVFNLVLSIGLVQVIGLPGPIYGTVLAQIVFILIPSAVYVPRLFARYSFVPGEAVR